MWTTKAQISLRIHAPWSAPLLFAAWIVTRFYSSEVYSSIRTYTVSPAVSLRKAYNRYMYICLSLRTVLQRFCFPVSILNFGTPIFELWVDSEIKVYRDTFKKDISIWIYVKTSVWKLPLFSYCWQYERGLRFAWKTTEASKSRPRVVCTIFPRILKGRKRTEAWTVHNTVLNSSMGIDITTYRIRIGHFGPGRRYISTGIAEIYSSSITRSDIHYSMLATMVLLTFLLKCCVMT